MDSLALRRKAVDPGAAELSFTVAADGAVKNVIVSKSSGYAELDKAAADCAALWRYKPALKDGLPVEYPWKTRVAWQQGAPPVGGDTGPAPPAGTIWPTPANKHDCAAELAGIPLHRKDVNAAGPTTVSLTVTAQGRVRDVRVTGSSGMSTLDQVAVYCVKDWRYRPATRDGQPVDADWTEQVTWEYGLP